LYIISYRTKAQLAAALALADEVTAREQAVQAELGTAKAAASASAAEHEKLRKRELDVSRREKAMAQREAEGPARYKVTWRDVLPCVLAVHQPLPKAATFFYMRHAL
jgi:hypothetical protein